MAEVLNSVRSEVVECMRRMASTVSVIALMDDGGEFLSATVTSAMLATMDPATMMVCLHGGTRMGAAIRSAKKFSINLLATDQVHIAAACAGGLDHAKRFGAANWETNDLGVPILVDAQACLICEKTEEVSCGTHIIAFGEVTDARHRTDSDPLIYLNREYGHFQKSIQHDLARHSLCW